MKKKGVAGFLALFFGIFGVHRFYLGQRFLGVIYFLGFIVTMTASVESDAPIVGIVALLAFIDAVLFFVMPKEDFNERYNKKYLKQTGRYQKRQREDFATYEEERGYRPSRPAPQKSRKTADKERLQALKQAGIKEFREFDYEQAVYYFKEALEIKGDDPSLHFNLACCHSLLEEADEALESLDMAIQYGFNDFEKINSHDALAFLRTKPSFEDFVKNDYKIIRSLPKPSSEPNLLDSKPTPVADERLEKLLLLKEKGILDEEEFQAQKEKLLNS